MMERQESQHTLGTIDFAKQTKEKDETGDNSDEDPNSPYNESNLDLFSHDSTHVQLVIEAEKQTNLARKKVAMLMQKLSTDAAEKKSFDREETDDARDETDGIDDGDGNDDGDANDPGENDEHNINLDNLRIQADNVDTSSNASEHKSNDNDDGNRVFEKMVEPSQNDIEHLKQCILPLSPSAGHKKRISGKFEFKRMNSVLTVVKSFDDESKNSYSSAGTGKSKSSKSGFFIRRKGSMQSRGTEDSCHSFNDSNALTDDAWMMAICEKEKRNMMKKQRKKDKKAGKGDLPPRSSKRRNYGGSTGAAASEAADREDVISVHSTLSELSLESVGRKIRNNGPLVVTESQREIRIPDTICLKTQIKLSRLGRLRKRLSFNKGKASF
jgi:hypothetical protein